MSGPRITNCHIHTFTQDHVPPNYPVGIMRLFHRMPWLVLALAWIAQMIGQHPAAEKLRRLAKFHGETGSGSQREVLEHVARHYPRDTRFVVLPMDLSSFGYGRPRVGLAAQHDALGAMSKEPEWRGRVLPFGTIDPRADPEASELWRAVNAHHFRGVKIYPRLGFAPTDPVLMQKVYPEMVRRGLPLMTHCSRGGVQGRRLNDYSADRYTEPQAYIPVMMEHPGLKICLAHFGGDRDWRAYIDEGTPTGGDFHVRQNWQICIRKMIGCGDWPDLWTDISYTLFYFEDYAPFLRIFLEGDDPEAQRLRRRVLFGSDFYMTRQERLSERAVCFRLRNVLGEELFRQIAETNPAVWLGEADEPPLP